MKILIRKLSSVTVLLWFLMWIPSFALGASATGRRTSTAPSTFAADVTGESSTPSLGATEVPKSGALPNASRAGIRAYVSHTSAATTLSERIKKGKQKARNASLPSPVAPTSTTTTRSTTTSMLSTLSSQAAKTLAAAASLSANKPLRRCGQRFGCRGRSRSTSAPDLSPVNAAVNEPSSPNSPLNNGSPQVASSVTTSKTAAQNVQDGTKYDEQFTADPPNSEDAEDDDDGIVEVEIPGKVGFYAYSQRQSYSSALGGDPAFSSSETLNVYPKATYKSDDPVRDSRPPTKREDHPEKAAATEEKPQAVATSESKSKRKCYTIQKPMPSYLHYNGKLEQKEGGKVVRPMMTCSVCGNKDDPYEDGGYTEECSFSPSKESKTYAAYYGPPKNTYNPVASADTNDKTYSETAQSPYIPYHRRRYSNVPESDKYDSYGGGYYGDADAEPHATRHAGRRRGYKRRGDDYGHSRGGHDDSHGDHDDDHGGHGDHDDEHESYGPGPYDDEDVYRAETGDSVKCHIKYKGRHKCKVCGDSQTDPVFSEQCDYDKDQPEVHRSNSYNYGSGSEKNYRSPKQGRRHGHHYEGPSSHDEDGYGDGSDGAYDNYHYPDYGNYGSGSGYGPRYDLDAYYSQPYYDPYYGSHDSELYGGGNGRGHGGDSSSYTGSHNGGTDGSGRKGAGGKSSDNSRDGDTYSGSSDTLDFSAQAPPTPKISASSPSSTNDKKRTCKVTYKEISSPYTATSSTSKEKPKMKCLVCTSNGGYGGVTEECSYNGGGELTASFPGSTDLSSVFERPLQDHTYLHDFDDPFHESFF